MTENNLQLTRRHILFGVATALISAPAIVRVAALMPIRVLPLELFTPERKVPTTLGEWHKQCFLNNLDHALKAGRPMTFGPVGGDPISIAEARQLVADARAQGWLAV